MIKQGILVGGLVFYAFIITSIVKDIREQNFNKSFLRIIDNNDDGIITEKQIKKDFTPCAKFDGKKLMRQFKDYGRRADLNELSEFLTPKTVLSMVKQCVGNIETATNPEHLKNLNKEEIEKELLEAYDLDKDNQIKWAEFNIFNQFLKKQPKNLRQIFRFFDKNHNWVIEHKEIQKSKPRFLADFLGSGKRK